MNKFKGTPGPWTISGIDIYEADTDNMIVRVMPEGQGDPAANQRAIAAVPEFIAFVQSVLEEQLSHGANGDMILIRKAEELLYKAIGSDIKTIVIPQKQNASHVDIASQHDTREIDFPEGHKFAVVLSAKDNRYSTYETAAAVIEADSQDGWIIDSDGYYYIIENNKLVQDGNVIRQSNRQ